VNEQLGLPYVATSETSQAAAKSVVPNARTLRAAVLRVIQALGPLTDEQIQEALHMNPSTQRPRRVELVEGGHVRDSGRRAKTRSGRSAVLWEAV
jgi:hypothetical protein